MEQSLTHASPDSVFSRIRSVTSSFRQGVMDAGRVARAGHDGLRRGKTLVIPGLRNRILAFSVRLSPRVLVTRVAAYLQA